MSTAHFPAVTVSGAIRRLEALCADTCVAISAGTSSSCLMPEIRANSTGAGFDLTVGPPDSPILSLECMPHAATWIGRSNEMSIWIIDAGNRLHRCVTPEQSRPRSEALTRYDRIVAVSKSIAQGLDALELTLEMALCDDPSLTTACSWILDAADDVSLRGPHVVAAWRAN